MNIYLSKKDRQALKDAGFPRQTIHNWIHGAAPRIGNRILIEQITGKKFTRNKDKITMNRKP